MISNYLDMSGKNKTLLRKQYEYIKASEKIRNDINSESNPFKMLELALLCISCSTGDLDFYKYNKNKIIDYMTKHNIKKVEF